MCGRLFWSVCGRGWTGLACADRGRVASVCWSVVHIGVVCVRVWQLRRLIGRGGVLVGPVFVLYAMWIVIACMIA